MTNLEISPWQVVWPRVMLIAGLGLLFAPANVAAYMYTPRDLRGAAVGLFSLLRNEGERRDFDGPDVPGAARPISHPARRASFSTRSTRTSARIWPRPRPLSSKKPGDPALSRPMALQSLEDLRDQQASSLAYFDIFSAAAAISLALVLLVFFMKRSVAEKGAHLAAE